METSVKNIFQNIPEKLPDELFQTIFKNNALHIERIVSKGYRTDPDHWYDQDHSELVLVLKGAATLAFASSGNLYFSLSNSLRVYDIDTGIKEDIGDFSGDVHYCQGLAFSPNDLLYGVVPHDGDLDTYDFFKIDIENAVTHLIGTYEGHLNQSLVFTPDGRLFGLGVDGEYSIYRSSYFAEMDPTTGAIIGQVFSFPGDYTGLALVPEPATLALMGLGGIFITTSRHRRKKIRSKEGFSH